MTATSTSPPPAARDLLALAVEVATRAGRLAVDGRRRAVDGTIGAKSSPTDVVSALDTEVEQLIRSLLLAERPADRVLGEEGGAGVTSAAPPGGVRWVVDPIDGTVNYLYGLPGWAVSIAAEVDGVAVAGVVHAPALGETWTATAGGGAELDGRPLACSTATDPARALVATGFGYRAEQRAAQAALLTVVLPAVRDIRRLGAASLDLCAVAAGRVDAYYEADLKPWDLAAGALVASEAGAGAVTLDDGTLLAAAPGLIGPLRALLSEAGAAVGRAPLRAPAG